MEKEALTGLINELVNGARGNSVATDTALRPDLAGMPFFAEPLVGFAAADDPYFGELKKPGVIGKHFLLPRDWLGSAQTVVSVFFPHTEQVKKANRQNMEWPADEWLHARIEGQVFLEALGRHVIAFLKDRGFDCISPGADPRFSTKSPLTTDKAEQNYYTSNWSERHVAHVCGLGTFGLSRGLITPRGISGRFTSFITGAYFEPTARPYSGTKDYCTRCGACVRHCPVKAISPETGKNHPLCSAFLNRTKEKHRPRYGCGKCQSGVPCENGIPGSRD
ncbi:4Fe-4S binding protein [Treponema primitia]|uniref:4Fe-4S binding protein n=1 Tax=Treponema primitia TaxID=88058 RepID=UPI003980CF2E